MRTVSPFTAAYNCGMMQKIMAARLFKEYSMNRMHAADIYAYRFTIAFYVEGNGFVSLSAAPKRR